MQTQSISTQLPPAENADAVASTAPPVSFPVLGCARVSTAASESDGLMRFAAWIAGQCARDVQHR